MRGTRPGPSPTTRAAAARRVLIGACLSGAALAAVSLGVAACADDGNEQAIDVETLSALATDASLDQQEHHHSHDQGPGQGYEITDLSMISASSGEIPSVDMIDVSSGAVVNLASLVDNEKPLLFWFWSPH